MGVSPHVVPCSVVVHAADGDSSTSDAPVTPQPDLDDATAPALFDRVPRCRRFVVHRPVAAHNGDDAHDSLATMAVQRRRPTNRTRPTAATTMVPLTTEQNGERRGYLPEVSVNDTTPTAMVRWRRRTVRTRPTFVWMTSSGGWADERVPNGPRISMAGMMSAWRWRSIDDFERCRHWHHWSKWERRRAAVPNHCHSPVDGLTPWAVWQNRHR